MEKDIIKTDKERLLIAEIFKQDGNIFIDFPNRQDVYQYELYGFLDCYLERMRKRLIDGMVETE